MISGLGILWFWKRWGLLPIFFCGDHDRFGLAINVGDSKRPERNKIDSGNKLGEKRWHKFPVPAEEMNHDGCDSEIEYVVSGGQSTFDEHRKDDDLNRIRDDGQHHGGAKLPTGRYGDGVVSHGCNASGLKHHFN